MAILLFFVALAIADGSTGDELARSFLTAVTKPPSEMFSPVTMDDSGRKYLAGAVTAVAPGLPPTAYTPSLYDYAVTIFAVADEATSHHIDGT
jgi:hypothetical protein